MESAPVTHDQLGRFSFAQPAEGYRFSMDSVLLAGFPPLAPGPQVAGPVVDLGAGCGVISVLLHGRGLAGPFTCVEIDPLAASCCQENLAAVGAPGQVLCQDLAQDHPALPRGFFALVVSNPPFTKAGHGRVPPSPARARARHELALEPEALWARAAGLLAQGGLMCLCWPPARLTEALTGLEQAGLRPRRLRLVHGRADRPATLALIEAKKGGRDHLKVEPPLIVYGQGQSYGLEVQALYDSLD